MKLKQIILSLVVGSTLSCGDMNKTETQDLVDKPITSESYNEVELKDAFDSDEYLQLGFKKDTYSDDQHLWGYIFKSQGKRIIYGSSKNTYHKSLESVLKRVKEKIGEVPAVLILDNDFNNDNINDLSDSEISTVISKFKPKKVAYLNY